MTAYLNIQYSKDDVLKKNYSLLQSFFFGALFSLASAHATTNIIEKRDIAVKVNMETTTFSALRPLCSTAWASCSLALCSGIPNTGTVTVKNNSPITAHNIQPQNLNIFNGNLSLISNNCATLPSGGSCQIVLGASPTSPIIDPGLNLIIKGDNTQAVTANISINGDMC
jgi:hypothetical protein